MVGFGGVHTEVLGDIAFALAPLSAERAAALLHGLRLAPLLRGYRGRPPVDVTAAAEVIAAVTAVGAAHPEIGEIEVNPLLVRPAGVLALDVRCVLEQLVVQAAHGQVDGRARHPARPVGRHERRHARQLRQRHQPLPVRPAGQPLLPLLPGHARGRGARLERLPDRVRLRHGLRPQPDDADAVRGELGGQVPGERLLSAAIAGPNPPTSGMPVRECSAVTVMITPEPLRTMCRAASRAVRK